jgi:hypothetical protein
MRRLPTGGRGRSGLAVGGLAVPDGERLDVGPVVGVLVGEDDRVDRGRVDDGWSAANVPGPASSQRRVAPPWTR